MINDDSTQILKNITSTNEIELIKAQNSDDQVVINFKPSKISTKIK